MSFFKMKFRRAGKPLPVTQLTDIIHRLYFQQVRFFIDLGMNLDCHLVPPLGPGLAARTETDLLGSGQLEGEVGLVYRRLIGLEKSSSSTVCS